MTSISRETATDRAPVVLVADDDPDDRMFAREALEAERVPADVRFVDDGTQLLDWIYRRRHHADPERYPAPELVVLDLRMPKKSGHEALAEIRRDPKLASLPIVVLTTSRDEEDIRRSYELGANAHVFKPSTFSSLAKTLAHICRFWLRA